MNKNRKIKRGLTTSLAVGMSVMMGAVPVFAAGTSSDADAVYKEETVYVNADATGTIDEVTVSNWLKNSGSVSGSLTDASTLKDIKTVSYTHLDVYKRQVVDSNFILLHFLIHKDLIFS